MFNVPLTALKMYSNLTDNNWYTYICIFLPLHIYRYIYAYIHACMHACINAYIHVCCWSYWCSGTGERFSNRKGTSCLPLLNAGFEVRKSETPNRQQTECPLTNRLSYRGPSKIWTQQVVPIVSEHSAHLTLLPIGFRIYTCLLLLIFTTKTMYFNTIAYHRKQL